MRKSSQGFTLIELIMVIVILGVLAAFALPRFASFSGDARQAAVQGFEGSIKSAAAITHAQWLIRSGVMDGDTITMESETINMVDGYPAATDAGLLEAIGGAASLGNFTSSVETTGASAGAGSGASDTAGVYRLTLQANCFVEYTEAYETDGDDPSTVVKYTVTTTTSGC